MRIQGKLNHQFYAMVSLLRQLWLRWLWTRPDNLWAFKVSLAIGLVMIPGALVGQIDIGCTFALGVVGAALAESNDHPRGRLRSLPVTVFSFLFVCLGVELLRPYPLAFAACFGLSAFVLVLLGGLGGRYKGISFGALLVSLYALLGAGLHPWYFQPVFLPLGALTYGLISLWLLQMRPYRLVKEQLALAYTRLGAYMELKSTLFPCDHEQHKRIRATLAERNIDVGRAVDSVKEVLYTCLDALRGGELKDLSPHYHRWLLLQQLHERAASSHQRYDVLSKYCHQPLLVKGMGQFLFELSKAVCNYGECILTGEKFRLSESLLWTREMLNEQLRHNQNDPQYSILLMLYTNLRHLSELLATADEEVGVRIPIDQLAYRPEPLPQRLRALLSTRHTLFRHAVRTALCLVVGYGIMSFFDIPRGAWIPLTALFVCQRSYVATRRRLSQRIVGTLSGVALGFVFARLLPTQGGQIVLLLFSIFTFFYWVRKRYAYAVGFITIFVISISNLQAGIAVHVMGYRLLCTIIGSFLAYLSVRYLWPDWQYRHLPQLMSDAMAKTRRYFHTIYMGEACGLVYYHNRRKAHQADNAIALAWQGMLVEPKDKRFMQRKTYALTYRNHALLSYVSAFGVHHYGKPLSPEALNACGYINRIMQQVEYNFNPNLATQPPGITSQRAKQWCRDLKERQLSEDDSMLILYNIARVAGELLSDSQSGW